MTLFRLDSIADSFNRAASTYDQYAYVQKKTAGHLSEFLPGKQEVRRVLETGSGTGFYSKILSDTFPHAEIFSLDLSFNMNSVAAERLQDAQNVHFFTADAEKLPIASDETFDLITSNGVIQWFSSLSCSIESFKEHLKPGGMLLVSFFGNKTLEELASALRSEIRADARIAAETFPSVDASYKIFSSMFSKVEIMQRTIARTYPSITAMLRALKMTGVAPAGNVPLIRTRGDMKKIEETYMQDTGRVTATYHVIIIRAIL